MASVRVARPSPSGQKTSPSLSPSPASAGPGQEAAAFDYFPKRLTVIGNGPVLAKQAKYWSKTRTPQCSGFPPEARLDGHSAGQRL